MKKVLVTCPPMLGMFDDFVKFAADKGIELHAAETTQTLSEEELKSLLPDYDGWIIGDDPATFAVFEKAQHGKLKAAVKWGIGVDNVDFEACKQLGIPITNTPDMFGGEVADLAMCYLLGLARQAFYIDRNIRDGLWSKPAGASVAGKTIGIIGYGDIGFSLAKRLSGFDVNVISYDPGVDGHKGLEFVERVDWPEKVETLDYLVLTCSLNPGNHHMLNEQILERLKNSCSIVNVARGPLIDESALVTALNNGSIGPVALDVFEVEPLPMSSDLRNNPLCIFGSHNGSNTAEAVTRASMEALKLLSGFLYER